MVLIQMEQPMPFDLTCTESDHNEFLLAHTYEKAIVSAEKHIEKQLAYRLLTRSHWERYKPAQKMWAAF